jgi:hypothetical protein
LDLQVSFVTTGKGEACYILPDSAMSVHYKLESSSVLEEKINKEEELERYPKP